MCGIAGIVSLGNAAPPTRERITAMVQALRHRGPDEFGLYRDELAGLGHARLSIIDLLGGQQPMTAEGSSCWITFNGEIYNFVELRQELQALGRRFRTQSDTEVLLQAWDAWGERAFARFNGQFAVGIWDRKRRRLVLARDRFGVRPLYYAEHAGAVIFASEVKAIFAGAPELPRAFDPVGLEQTFTFWSVIAPRTAFSSVREVRAGHVRIYENGRIEERAFVTPRFPVNGEGEFRGTREDAAVALREALARAVSLRIERSDVPVGSYLSGGLDSSLIAALAHGFKGDRLHTFSLRFANPEYDETFYQRLVSQRLGSAHHDLVVTRDAIAEVFPEVVGQAERPLLRTAPAPLYLLSRQVRDAGFKVVITGEGADEMFAGYDLFREAKIRRFWAHEPASTGRPQLLSRIYPYLSRSPSAAREMAHAFFGRGLSEWRNPTFAHDPRWRSVSALRRLLSPEMIAAQSGLDVIGDLVAALPPEFSSWTFLARDQQIEIETFFSSYLLSAQGDRMLAGNSVEGRFPFLDPDVVALAESLPPRFKLPGLNEKRVLKDAAEPYVPEAVLNRKKQPYRAPDADSFVGSDAAWVAGALRAEAVRAAGVFRPEAVDALWRKCNAEERTAPLSNADNMALVGILSTQLLHQRFIAQPPAADSASITFRTLVELTEETAA